MSHRWFVFLLAFSGCQQQSVPETAQPSASEEEFPPKASQNQVPNQPNKDSGSSNRDSEVGEESPPLQTQTQTPEPEAPEPAAEQTLPSAAKGPITWVRRDWIKVPSAQDIKAGLPTQYTFLSFQYNEFEKDSELFRCPRHSFLVGMKSYLEATIVDRSYQARCQFLEDSQGLPVVRDKCEVKQANGNRGPMKFSCPDGKFITGHQTRFYSRSRDRVHLFQCCGMRTITGDRIAFSKNPQQDPKARKTPTSGLICEEPMGNKGAEALFESPWWSHRLSNERVNAGFKKMDFTCASDMVLHSIESEYVVQGKSMHDKVTQLKDRTFTFRCCQVSVGGVPPQEEETGFGL